MNFIIRLTEKISDLAAGLSALMLGGMATLILVEIVLWNTMQKTTLIADEYSAYGLAAIIFLGAGYCLKEKGHIRITIVLGRLPAKLARAITCFSTAVTAVFMSVLWWNLFKLVMSSHRYGSTSGTLTGTPLWVPQAIMLVGAACFAIQLFGMVVKTFAAIGSGEDVV